MNSTQQKPETPKNIDAYYEQMTYVTFPRGEEQIDEESRDMEELLEGVISFDLARKLLINSKGRALIAMQHGNRRLVDAVEICKKNMISLKITDDKTAVMIAYFAVLRMLDDTEYTDSLLPWPKLTKSDATLIAKITAYRSARFLARSTGDAYEKDPISQIVAIAEILLTMIGGEFDTEKNANHKCYEVMKSLILYDYGQKHGDKLPYDEYHIEMQCLQELRRTRELLDDEEKVPKFTNYDPAELVAASQLDVPFKVALTLAREGALQTPREPAECRKNSL